MFLFIPLSIPVWLLTELTVRFFCPGFRFIFSIIIIIIIIIICCCCRRPRRRRRCRRHRHHRHLKD